MPCKEGTSSAVVQETTDRPMDPEDDVSIHERGLEDTPVLLEERDYLQQELELYRRKRKLLERESTNCCANDAQRIDDELRRRLQRLKY